MMRDDDVHMAHEKQMAELDRKARREDVERIAHAIQWAGTCIVVGLTILAVSITIAASAYIHHFGGR